jgi:hypothetical protein
MTMKTTRWLSLCLVFLAGVAAGGLMFAGTAARAQSAARVFELRTYTAGEGKLDLLHARFRNHTVRLFNRHGMTNVWYGKPLDPPLSQDTLIYLLAHQSRDAAKQSWDAFRADPEWQQAAKESGVGQVKVVSVFLEPADYSPMK